MRTYDVIVIGGGVIGVAVAYYLSKEGMKIALIERYVLISFSAGLIFLNMNPSKINFMVAGIIVITLMVIGVVKQISSRITRERLLIEKTSKVVKEGVNTNESDS